VRMRAEPTFADLTAEYLERHAEPKKRASSLRDDRYMIKRVTLPRLGKFQLRTIGRQDVESVHLSLKDRPYFANRVLSLLSKMFSLAVEWGWIAENPTRGIPRFPESYRERYLSHDEIHRLVGALDSYSDKNAANALKLLLFTGARVGEVLKAEWSQFEWSQFEFENGVWTKPRLNTKQNRVEHVPLSNKASAVLQSMKPPVATGPLFPGKDGGTRVSLVRPWLQACKAAGLVTVENDPSQKGQIKKYRPMLRIHDLRHNFASHLVSKGVSLHVVAKLLGHSQLSTTMRYAHLQDHTLRAAANQFGDLVMSAKVA
jgi:integrase